MKDVVNFIRHLFVPKEENNFRAKALHVDLLTYYLLFALVLTFSFKNVSGLRNVLGFATDITVEKLYELTNIERKKNGLPPLSYSHQLSEAAQRKATDMFAKNYWAHYAPDGTTPWDFILSTGYRYEYAGENLAKNFLFSQGVVDAWMASPTHRENILRKDYTEIGFAIVNGVLNGEETTLVVQMFGKPLNYEITKNNAPAKPVLVEEKNKAEIAMEKPQAAILAKGISKPKINFFNLSLDINIVFLLFLVLALAMDFYFAAHLNIVRIGGNNLAHLIFVGFIFLGLIYLTKGSIL